MISWSAAIAEQAYRKPGPLAVCLVVQHTATHVVDAELDTLERCVGNLPDTRLVCRGEWVPPQIRSLMPGCDWWSDHHHFWL